MNRTALRVVTAAAALVLGLTAPGAFGIAAADDRPVDARSWGLSSELQQNARPRRRPPVRSRGLPGVGAVRPQRLPHRPPGRAGRHHRGDGVAARGRPHRRGCLPGGPRGAGHRRPRGAQGPSSPAPGPPIGTPCSRPGPRPAPPMDTAAGSAKASLMTAARASTRPAVHAASPSIRPWAGVPGSSRIRARGWAWTPMAGPGHRTRPLDLRTSGQRTAARDAVFGWLHSGDMRTCCTTFWPG